MRSDQWIRAVVAGYWLRQGQMDEALSLVGQTAEVVRAKAVYGVTRNAVANLEIDDIDRWIGMLDQEYRLHALVGAARALAR